MSKRIELRVTDKQYAAWAEDAVRCRRTLSDWLRLAAEAFAAPSNDDPMVEEAIKAYDESKPVPAPIHAPTATAPISRAWVCKCGRRNFGQKCEPGCGKRRPR